jgi:hypothetical protein
MHCSMQFSDSKEHVQSDAKKIFDRAAKRKIDWITGTEAGEDPVRSAVKTQAGEHDYTFREFKSLWIALRKDTMKRAGRSHEEFTVVDNDLTVGAGHDTSLLVERFTHTEAGQVTVMCSHYPRFGRPGAKDPQYRANLKYTQQIAHFIGDKAKLYGKDSLVFYGGDQNIPDNVSDTFFGEPMTSLGDELHKYPNTGHGPIDVIASYDGNKNVRGEYWRGLSDKTFALYTDHYPVEGGFVVRGLGTK